jgi:DnaJ homolog subfamily C member 28
MRTKVYTPLQRAKAAGQFNNIKGRGKPLAVSTDESNPFIAREEYLLNRIVQRNEAAPPWVELQAGLSF